MAVCEHGGLELCAWVVGEELIRHGGWGCDAGYFVLQFDWYYSGLLLLDLWAGVWVVSVLSSFARSILMADNSMTGAKWSFRASGMDGTE